MLFIVVGKNANGVRFRWSFEFSGFNITKQWQDKKSFVILDCSYLLQNFKIKKMNKILFSILFFGFTIFIVSCGKDDDTNEPGAVKIEFESVVGFKNENAWG